MTLAKLLNLPRLWLPCLLNGDSNSSQLRGLLQELDELVYLIGLEQCLEHGKVLARLLCGSLCKTRIGKFRGLMR